MQGRGIFLRVVAFFFLFWPSVRALKKRRSCGLRLAQWEVTDGLAEQLEAASRIAPATGYHSVPVVFVSFSGRVRVMMLCSLVGMEAENCDPEDGDCTFLRNVNKHQPTYTEFCHRRLYIS